MNPEGILIKAQNALSEKFPAGIVLQRSVSLSHILSLQTSKGSDDEVLRAFLEEVSRHPKVFFRPRPARRTDTGPAQKPTSSAPQDVHEDVAAISDRSECRPFRIKPPSE